MKNSEIKIILLPGQLEDVLKKEIKECGPLSKKVFNNLWGIAEKEYYFLVEKNGSKNAFEVINNLFKHYYKILYRANRG